jgi:ABC-type phosphate transport system permease subunit
LSLLPAVLVISVICIPYLAKATETSLNHQLTNSPAAFLTYPVWTQHASPSKAQQYLAYDAALLLFVLVLIVIILGRMVVAISRRHAE